MEHLTLVTGGARSGKSTWAEKLAAQSELAVIYLATGQAFDQEMAERIAIHQRRRPPHWQTVAEPLELVTVLEAHPRSLVLLDCLSLWVSNQFLTADPESKQELLDCQQRILSQCDRLISRLHSRPDPTIIVTNEVGMGLVPDNPLGRYFRDTLGWVNQRVAQAADQVFACFAGIPLKLK